MVPFGIEEIGRQIAVPQLAENGARNLLAPEAEYLRRSLLSELVRVQFFFDHPPQVHADMNIGLLRGKGLRKPDAKMILCIVVNSLT